MLQSRGETGPKDYEGWRASAWKLRCAFDREGSGLGVRRFAWLRSAYGDAVAAWGDGSDALIVDLREGARVEGEGDVSGLAGCEFDAVEAGECLIWRDVGVRWGEVEFRNFFACSLAGIFYVGFNGEGVTGVEVRGGEFDV